MKIRQQQIDAFLPKSDQEIISFIIKHLQDESPELLTSAKRWHNLVSKTF
jgi:hypothetical protein